MNKQKLRAFFISFLLKTVVCCDYCYYLIINNLKYAYRIFLCNIWYIKMHLIGRKLTYQNIYLPLKFSVCIYKWVKLHACSLPIGGSVRKTSFTLVYATIFF